MSSDPARIELQTYERALAAMLPEHAGQYVVIRGETIEDYFSDYASALDWAYGKFGLDRFFVKRVAPHEGVTHFTRDLGPCRP